MKRKKPRKRLQILISTASKQITEASAKEGGEIMGKRKPKGKVVCVSNFLKKKRS